MTIESTSGSHAEHRASSGKASLTWCACCNSFGFEYGSLYLNLGETDFVRLVKTIETAVDDRLLQTESKLFFRITDSGILMVVPTAELPDLWMLLRRGFGWLNEHGSFAAALAASAIH